MDIRTEKFSRVYKFESERAFFDIIEQRLEKQGYELLETIPFTFNYRNSVGCSHPE